MKKDLVVVFALYSHQHRGRGGVDTEQSPWCIRFPPQEAWWRRLTTGHRTRRCRRRYSRLTPSPRGTSSPSRRRYTASSTSSTRRRTTTAGGNGLHTKASSFFLLREAVSTVQSPFSDAHMAWSTSLCRRQTMGFLTARNTIFSSCAWVPAPKTLGWTHTHMSLLKKPVVKMHQANFWVHGLAFFSHRAGNSER